MPLPLADVFLLPSLINAPTFFKRLFLGAETQAPFDRATSRFQTLGSTIVILVIDAQSFTKMRFSTKALEDFGSG